MTDDPAFKALVDVLVAVLVREIEQAYHEKIDPDAGTSGQISSPDFAGEECRHAEAYRN